MSAGGEERLRDALGALWERYAANVERRLDLLERVARAGRAAADHERAEARAAAHQLAGSLGTYGLERAGRRAAAVEEALDAGRVPAPEEVAALRAEVAREAPPGR